MGYSDLESEQDSLGYTDSESENEGTEPEGTGIEVESPKPDRLGPAPSLRDWCDASISAYGHS